MWAGKIDLAYNQHRLEYALVHMQQFGQNLKKKRFEEALSIVSNGNQG